MRAFAVLLTMEKEKNLDIETSILPLKYVDLIEDVFHAVLAVALFLIGLGAFFFSIKRLLETGLSSLLVK